MRFKFFLLPILILLNVIISCKEIDGDKANLNHLRSIVEKSLRKEINIPDSTFLYRPFTSYVFDSIKMANSKYKIYSHINTSCVTCIGDIEKWKNLAMKFIDDNTAIFLICESTDDFELFKYICESQEVSKFPFPFFLNYNNQFIELNPFMKESQEFRTVLTDRQNKILLLGNPIHSDEIKNLYMKEIKE